jgi:hypothetical protein
LCEADGFRFGQRNRRFAGGLLVLGWSFLGQQSNKRRIHSFGCPMSPLKLSFGKRKFVHFQCESPNDRVRRDDAARKSAGREDESEHPEDPFLTWTQTSRADGNCSAPACKDVLFSRDGADSSRVDYRGHKLTERPRTA